jgi:hypothetical protein
MEGERGLSLRSKPYEEAQRVQDLDTDGWREVISEVSLEAESVQVTVYKHLVMKVWVLRIGCLSKNNNYTTFDAKQQAKRFFGSYDDFEVG